MRKKRVSALLLTQLLLGVLTLALDIQPVRANGTIYIRPDGSVEGTDKIVSVDNVTYTFTDNINNSIVVERDNIVVDGIGYTLQGTGSGVGLNLAARSNVTIKNMEIEAFRGGIWLKRNSKNNSISANNITNNESGISIWHSSNNTILGNNITDNGYGIFSYDSLNNSLSGNRIADNDFGIKFAECSKTNFFGNEIAGNGIGVMFDSSYNNSFSRNNVTSNRDGIYFQGIKIHSGYGIYLVRSSDNTIYGNNIASNEDGVSLRNSPNNNVSINIITSNQYGIVLHGFSYMYASIHGNNITNNEVGIKVGSELNFISYNNFINNTKQVAPEEYSFFRLNYWSDYTGKDRNGDNIGDIPYGDYLDRYPLMKPWSLGWHPEPSPDQAAEEETPFWMQWWFWTIVIVVIVGLVGAIYLLKREKPPNPTAPPLPSEGARDLHIHAKSKVV